MIRADASVAIGSGHIMRCLTLAEGLRARGDEVLFLTRAHEGHLAPLIERRGFGVRLLSAPDGAAAEGPYAHSPWLGVSEARDAEETLALLGETRFELLIVDHYGLGAPFERSLAPHFKSIVAIDDLADRAHEVDALVDPSLHADEPAAALYRGLIPDRARLFAGPSFALLRPEFSAARPAALARRSGSSETILISMGGVDVDDRSSAILRALEPLSPARVDLVMGSRAPALARVRELIRALPYPITLHIDTDEMPRLMSEADLAIGAAGGTAYERACLGLPSLVMALAENQRANIDGLARAGAVIEIDEAALEGDRLARLIEGLAAERLKAISAAGASLVDGLGVGRVLRAIDELGRER